MSEYQYYEFMALDRPLSAEQQKYMRSLSSRVELTPTQATFTYSYGSFRGDPLKVLEQHFDALLYLANWGSKQLAFRFPRTAVDSAQLLAYCMLEEMELTTTPDHVLLNITFHEEEGLGWIEGEGLLPTMVSLREDILRGDLRSLYLVWLKAAVYFADSMGDDEDDLDEEADSQSVLVPSNSRPVEAKAGGDELMEPPVPPGLQQLTVPLRALIDFFEIDPDLVAAAALASPTLGASDEPIERWVSLLSEAERNSFLVRVARGEPRVDIELLRRLRELGGNAGKQAASPSRRSFASIRVAAEEIRQRRQEHERQEAERARLRRLEELSGRESALWEQVTLLIKQMTAKSYDEAVAILSDLREIAAHRGERKQFSVRVAAIRSEYSNRSALLKRMRDAGL